MWAFAKRFHTKLGVGCTTGFEASAGWAGVANMLAIPSGVGGALARLICSGQKKVSPTSERLM